MKLIQSRPYGASAAPVRSSTVSSIPARVGATVSTSSVGKDLLLVGTGAAVGYFGFGRTWQKAAIGGAIGLGAAILTG